MVISLADATRHWRDKGHEAYVLNCETKEVWFDDRRMTAEAFLTLTQLELYSNGNLEHFHRW